MISQESLLILSTAGLIGLGVIAGLAAWAWAGWLKLRLHELDQRRVDAGPGVGQRIDLADLKERIRKLEAIAAGVDF